MAEERSGKFIVLEGTDGSGKTEQFNRLLLRMPENISVRSVDFPQYSKPSAYFVTKYLKGDYGELAGTEPKAASIFYAVDRFDARFSIEEWLAEGKVVLGNRYVGSNMGHQGSKFDKAEERADFFRWLYDLEYGIFGIPKPDLNIILHVPAEVSYELIARKSGSGRGYLAGARRDIHEADLTHLKRAEEVYLEIAKIFPADFKLVECVENGKLLSLEEVHEKVWAIAKEVVGI